MVCSSSAVLEANRLQLLRVIICSFPANVTQHILVCCKSLFFHCCHNSRRIGADSETAACMMVGPEGSCIGLDIIEWTGL